jgi:hypothetical protein
LDNLTSDGFLVNATTLPWCADPITLNGTSVVDSIMMTWDWIPAAAATNGGISSFRKCKLDYRSDYARGWWNGKHKDCLIMNF